MKLSDLQIKRIKPGTKPYKVSDGGGLFLWVTPSSGKIWRWAYRHEGHAKLMTFGRYPEISLAQARERHAEAPKLLATSVDPMAQRKAEKLETTNSFENVTLHWHEHWKHGKTLRHTEYVRRRLEADVLPVIGERPIAEIQAPELVAMVQAIKDRGAHEIAKRMLEATGQIFRYAVAHGYISQNPASSIRPSDILPSTHKTNYARVSAKELPDLLRAIEVYQGTHVIGASNRHSSSQEQL